MGFPCQQPVELKGRACHQVPLGGTLTFSDGVQKKPLLSGGRLKACPSEIHTAICIADTPQAFRHWALLSHSHNTHTPSPTLNGFIGVVRLDRISTRPLERGARVESHTIPYLTLYLFSSTAKNPNGVYAVLVHGQVAIIGLFFQHRPSVGLSFTSISWSTYFVIRSAVFSIPAIFFG